MEIIYSLQFQREYQSFSEEIRKKAKERERIFRKNPFDSRLKTHKPHGPFGGFWAFSIDYHYRIVFEFAQSDLVYFHAVGTHDVYK